MCCSAPASAACAVAWAGARCPRTLAASPGADAGAGACAAGLASGAGGLLLVGAQPACLVATAIGLAVGTAVSGPGHKVTRQRQVERAFSCRRRGCGRGCVGRLRHASGCQQRRQCKLPKAGWQVPGVRCCGGRGSGVHGLHGAQPTLHGDVAGMPLRAFACLHVTPGFTVFRPRAGEVALVKLQRHANHRTLAHPGG